MTGKRNRTNRTNRTKRNRDLNSICREIKKIEKGNIANAVKTGDLLEQAFQQCEHGQWGDWLQDNFRWSTTTAQRYRDVFALSQNPQFGDFSKLDLSVSALYLAAEKGPDDPGTKALFVAARKGRVTFNDAKLIFDDLSSHDDSDDTPPDDDAPPPDHHDSEVDAASELLCRLAELLNEPPRFWAKVIEDVGTEKVREIHRELKSALDEYNKDTEVKAKADRAEARASGGVAP
jgi:hypothetical protein